VHNRAEDGAIRADADRQGDYRDDAKHRTLGKTPDAIADIFEKNVHIYVPPSR
jgi:hypothetical protein